MILDGGSKAADFTNKLLFMIAKDNLPYQVVEKEGFQTFMKAVAPLYKIPSRSTVTTLMTAKYEFLSNMIKKQLSTVQHLSLTADIWTDPLNAKSYLGVTVHFLDNETHKSVTIGVTELDERHTAENLEKWLLDIVESWGINKDSIVAFVSDNAANIKKAIVDGFGLDKHLACFAHTLNLVPSTIIENDKAVAAVCKKVKSIVTYFKKSVAAADQLRAHSNLKLIQSVETRWNSTHAMLARFIELSDKVGSILLQSPTAPAMLSASELQTVKEFVKLLKPFEDATKIVCGEFFLTGSKVIPIVDTLSKKLQTFEPNTQIGQHLKKVLLENFHKRFEKIERVVNLAMATILDPRFKKIHFSDRVACSHTINKIGRIVNIAASKNKALEIETSDGGSVEQTDDFWSYHQGLANHSNSQNSINRNENEMPQDFQYYLNQPLMKMDESPIRYWNVAGNSPLADLAKRHLATIATSVPSERLFSKAGRIVTEARNRLTGDHLQQLLFLGSLSIEDWHFD